METQLARPDSDDLTPYRLVFQSVQVLLPPGQYLLGRESGCCDVILPHESVSQIHGKLIATPTSLQILDRHSEQGVYINGNRVSSGQLQAGDKLRLGRVQCSVAVEPVALVDVSTIHSRRTADRTQNKHDVTAAVAPSSEVIALGDLSQDSVEIPESILEQSLFDQLDESVGDLPVAPAADTAPSAAPPVQDASTGRLAPLPRQRFPGHEAATLLKRPYHRADVDSNRSPLAALASTTAGRLALLLILGWGSYGFLQLLKDPQARDREIYLQLQRYGDRFADLRASQAPPDGWSELRASVDQELPEIIEELERRASNERRVTQNLLRAARDCLPRMLQASPEPTWYEERFHEYLAEAHAALAGD